MRRAAATADATAVSVLAAVLLTAGAHAATITIVPGAGFTGAASATPVGGNTGTTVGAQRLIAVQYAADVYASRLHSSVDIRLDVSFDALPCGPSQGVLGSTGSNSYVRDFDGAPLAGTWYPVALANALAGADQCPPASECTAVGIDPDDLTARFQVNVGTSSCLSNLTWYYGLDGQPAPGQLDFATVALHEFAHGLGFASLVSLSSGAKAAGFDDAFMRNLEDHSTGKRWPDMSDSERVTSTTDTDDLHWVGANVVTNGGSLTSGRHTPSGHVEMYAPDPAESGASVSHFSTALSPDELMEPFLVGANHDVELTVAALDDIGWGEIPCGNGELDAGEECDDGNGDATDGCTNACTRCGNGIVTSPEQCDDGNLIDGDGCEANCTLTGILPAVSYSPSFIGKPDRASVKCLKTVAREVRRFLGTKYQLLSDCLDAVQEYKATVAAGKSPAQLQAALDGAIRRCSEPGSSLPDGRTLLGKIDAARTKAVGAIERRCSLPGATAIDGKKISRSASNDFDASEIAAHIDEASCAIDELIAGGYNGAAADLSTFTARASQGGRPLDSYFPCIQAVDLPPLDYSPIDGPEDTPSVNCQKAVGQAVRKFLIKRYGLLSKCLDTIQDYKAALEASASTTTIERALAAAEKKCVEPSAGAADAQTMLGRVAAAATKAIGNMERRCGSPGGTTIDGKSIGRAASGDLTDVDIETHATSVGCHIEKLIGLGYAGAASDLAGFTARASQGGLPLNQLLPCTP